MAKEREEKEEKKEKEETARGFTELARFWKESYLEGLEVSMKGQEETERLIKEAFTQGLMVQKEWLKLSRQWLQVWDEVTSVASGTPNPFLTGTTQYMEAVCGGVEPLLRVAEESFNTGFSLYEKMLAIPGRRYAREVNRRYMDAIIPG